MGTETLVSVDGVTRYFGRRRAVADLHLELGRGEVLGLLGPNGAGKSTTMQIICGVLAPSAGRVTVSGYDIAEYPRLAKRHLGYLPEHPPLYPDQTVSEFLCFCARLHGLRGRDATTAAARAGERCGLASVDRRLIGNLSRGYQQRVGVAQAILHDPPAIILDEPTVGLDPVQGMEIRELIRELGEDHGVILSTHILSEVESTCSRVAVISDGELVLQESLPELTRDTGGLEQAYLRAIGRETREPGRDATA